ncbi:MAG: apolipoprotein N-acyltransferase [Planctomycetaceae bacterium]|nr:apolipoprotein N-acyltransferase [Planctomycetaceae bacterium]
MTKTPQSRSTTGEQKSGVAELIAKGRQQRPSARMALLMGWISAALLWVSSPPLDLGPVAWIALVPLLLLCRLPQSVNRQGLVLWLAGLAFWLTSLQWMRLGDLMMYPAWLAHSAYLACYWPLFVWLTQLARRHFRMPLFVAAPIMWIGLEYLRGHLFTGFSWYLLGHTQYRWIGLIQVSDLAGGYGVSLLVMLANAAIAQLIPLRWLEHWGLILQREGRMLEAAAVDYRRQQWIGVVAAVLAVLAALGYGQLRRTQTDFETGPRIALIQGDFPATTKPLTREEFEATYRLYNGLTGLTVRHQPDVVVWPEAMFRYALFDADPNLTEAELAALAPHVDPPQWRNPQVHETLADLSQKTNAALIFGIPSLIATPQASYSHNSAVFVTPEGGVSGRYDKLHLVPFGEYVPLQKWLPFLAMFSPYGADGGMRPGDKIHVFEQEKWRFLPLICFEDTVPHLVRSLAAATQADGRDVDCLVNMSNDGWFHGSAEHDQHLITAAFRCVETRIPMVRAANMGISAFIDGDGVIREPETIIDLDAQQAGEAPRKTMRDPITGKFYRQNNWALISTVPLDPRGSLYVRCGDWLGLLSLICCAALTLHALFKRRPQEAAPATELAASGQD